MLQICDVRKKYVTGDLIQTALDGVSLTLRDNEFVAIATAKDKHIKMSKYFRV